MTLAYSLTTDQTLLSVCGSVPHLHLQATALLPLVMEMLGRLFLWLPTHTSRDPLGSILISRLDLKGHPEALSKCAYVGIKIT